MLSALAQTRHLYESLQSPRSSFELVREGLRVDSQNQNANIILVAHWYRHRHQYEQYDHVDSSAFAKCIFRCFNDAEDLPSAAMIATCCVEQARRWQNQQLDL